MRAPRLVFTAGAIGLCLALGAALAASEWGSEETTPTRRQAAGVETLVSGAFCTCGCGNRLPGSTRAPACFGCSVGKAEVSFIHESLAAGRSPGEIQLALAEPVTIEVFADYTDPDLERVWKLAADAARELAQHRVVLRTPARSAAALRAVDLAECARLAGSFSAARDALIRNTDPWDEGTLLRIAASVGLVASEIEKCLEDVDVGKQVAKDAEHVHERGLRALPAITVNRVRTPAQPHALRQAIRAVLLDESV